MGRNCQLFYCYCCLLQQSLGDELHYGLGILTALFLVVGLSFRRVRSI